MKNNGLLLLCLLFIPLESFSATAVWQVSPNICVTKELGDECEMEVEIVIKDIPPGKYCLYQNDDQINCFESNIEKQKIELSFSENMQLTLVNQTGTAILQQAFTVKGRSAPQTRRRVRQPWSLF